MVSLDTKNTPRHPVSALDSHLGYWLRRVSNAVSGSFARALQANQTSVAEWVVLSELHERGHATPSDLARVLGMTRGAISKVIDKLEAKIWIRAEANVSDNRSQLLSLTREGRRHLPVLAKLADENDAHFFTCLDESERKTLFALLVKLSDHHQIHDVPTE